MATDPVKMSDAEVIALAEAEREAGVPDMQAAEASAAANERSGGENAGEVEAAGQLGSLS